MDKIGFGVLVMGKPSGIWPLTWTHAMEKASREKLICADVKVVPIYIGMPVEIIKPPKKKEPA